MAATLHGGFCHIFHHNHSHESNNSTTQHQHDEPENINVQAASLHVLGDFIQSIGVMISAVVIKIYVSRKSFGSHFSFKLVLLIVIKASGENCRPIAHVFILNHRSLHNTESF